MQYPTTRAIQYEDVAHAADALLQEGLRPTIERIRMRIGRGSPNTVSPMLEQWFSGLGQRLNSTLGVEKISASDNDLPNSVLQAATALWVAARQQAQEQADNACAATRMALADEALQLQQARAELQAHELVVNGRLQAMEETLQLSTQQLQESNDRWKTAQRTLAQRDEEIVAKRADIVQLTTQQSTLQQQLTAAQAQAQEERIAQENRHRANEHRWIEEVDRARQESKKWVAQAQDAARKIENLQTALEQSQATQQAHALAQTQQIETLRAELVSAQHQTQEARALVAHLQNNEKPRWSGHIAPRSPRVVAVVRKKLTKPR
ncbi:MAG: DNA-binding protein [Burkholderiaceae bacterium]|nr:DNA-binding protein [Burkholderiaceae bacterium]